MAGIAAVAGLMATFPVGALDIVRRGIAKKASAEQAKVLTEAPTTEGH